MGYPASVGPSSILVDSLSGKFAMAGVLNLWYVSRSLQLGREAAENSTIDSVHDNLEGIVVVESIADYVF